MSKILLGCDPEFFLRRKDTGEFVSAHGMFPGTKEMPYPLEKGAVQVDGHALEFNIAPAASEDEFVENIKTVFAQVKDMINEVDPNLEVALDPVATFTKEYWESLPMDSKILGCEPDFNADDGEVLDSPDIIEVPLRTGSGHIHVGWTEFDDPFQEDEFKKRLAVANKLTPALLEVAKKWEDEKSIERRKYYGRNGAFRPKHYGVELRALDNYWLKDEEAMRDVYRTTVSAFEKEFPDYATAA